MGGMRYDGANPLICIFREDLLPYHIMIKLQHNVSILY